MGTRSYFGLVAVVAAVAMTMACNSPRRGGGGGGGGGEDAGGGGGDTDGGAGDTDSGGIMLMDSGMTGTDSGPTPPECTTSADCATDEECIEGSCETMSVSCPEEIVGTIGPYCAYETATCWDECTDGTCRQGCLDADPDAENCNACVQQNFISCTNDAGCQDEYNCWAKCVADFGCTDRACVTTNCLDEDDAWNACIDALPSTTDCSPQLAMCFMTS